METTGPITFRPLSPSDMSLGMRLRQAAGWNQTEADWALLLRLGGPHLVAEYAGLAAGTLTALDYEGFRWIGMVLVDPAFRKKGIGTALLREAIRQAGPDIPLRLDATPAGKLLYDQLGFRTERNLWRMERRPQAIEAPSAFTVMPMQAADIERLAGYDAAAFGAQRQAVLADLFARAPGLCGCATQQGRLAGYCLGRPGSNFVQIGPLIASDRATARALLVQALAACAGQPVVLDTFEADAVWLGLLRELGFVAQRPLIRMYLGPAPPPGMTQRQFAIAGPELG